MILLSFSILILWIVLNVLPFFTHNKKRLTLSIHVIGILFGFLISYSTYIIYLCNVNSIYSTVTKYIFFLPKSVWNFFAVHGINRDLLLSGIILGTTLFFYHYFLYTLAYYSSYTTFKWTGQVQFIALIPLLLENILFNPYLYKTNFHALGTKGIINQLYYFVSNYLTPIFGILKYVYILGCVFLLLYGYLKLPNIKVLKRPYFYNFMFILLLGIVYVISFSWFPKLLITSTLVGGFYIYHAPHLTTNYSLLNILPSILLFIYLAIIFFLYKYWNQISRNRQIEISLEQVLNTASQGMRIVSHALKNELIAIQSESNYLIDKLSHQQDDEITYSLNLINTYCQEALNKLNSGYSMLKKHRLVLENIPLIPLLTKICETFQHKFPDIIIECQHPDLDLSAYMDQNTITEVFENILINAVDAIRIKQQHNNTFQPKITVGMSSVNGYHVIEISDNGIGMNEETSQKAFQPFYSTKSSSTNWGVGLSFCSKIIQAHQGKILIKNKVKTGCTLIIYIPQQV